eukprot:545938-Pyramimonas_sp.AAC.1
MLRRVGTGGPDRRPASTGLLRPPPRGFFVRAISRSLGWTNLVSCSCAASVTIARSQWSSQLVSGGRLIAGAL